MAKILKQKDINLLLALKKRGTSSAEAMRRKKIIIILASVVLAIALITGLYFIKIMSLNHQKEEAIAYIESPAVISAYATASDSKARATEVTEKENWLQSLLTTIDGYPHMNSKKFSQIYGYTGGRIEILNVEYDNPTGTLMLEGSSKSATGVPIFVTQLRMSGLFDDVTYEGYTNTPEDKVTGTTVNPDGTVTDNVTTHEKYTFKVNCQVKAGK